jgi:hypothetical protein
LGYTLFDLLVCDTNVITDMAKSKMHAVEWCCDAVEWCCSRVMLQ